MGYDRVDLGRFLDVVEHSEAEMQVRSIEEALGIEDVLVFFDLIADKDGQVGAEDFCDQLDSLLRKKIPME